MAKRKKLPESDVPNAARYRRGRVTIADRPGLEEAACECYAAAEKHFRDVLPGVKDRLTAPHRR